MVSNNYSPYFQPLPSQEVRVVPYVEPPFVPTVDENAFPYAEYMAQDEAGTYTVNVNLLSDKESITIEHVSNGNLLMRIQIVREKLLDRESKFQYCLLSSKYIELCEKYRLREKAERKEERKRERERMDNQPIILVGDFVVKHGTNAVISAKNITQSALIATRDTIAKTSAVAKENIAALVFFCSYALVKFPSSQDIGRNYRTDWYMGSRKPVQFNFQSILERQKRDSIFKQTSQDTSYSHSPIAQLLYNKKKM